MDRTSFILLGVSGFFALRSAFRAKNADDTIPIIAAIGLCLVGLHYY